MGCEAFGYYVEIRGSGFGASGPYGATRSCCFGFRAELVVFVVTLPESPCNLPKSGVSEFSSPGSAERAEVLCSSGPNLFRRGFLGFAGVVSAEGLKCCLARFCALLIS